MKKEVIVISLGGSLIIPNDVDYKFLNEFKRTILKFKNKYSFIIVCGGGILARKYIEAIKFSKGNEQLQSFAGISATRTNARFVSYFFGIDPKLGIPHTLKSVENYLNKSPIVFCGALEYKPNQTSDATASQIAEHFKSIFINLTDVCGLFTKNPKKFKDAKFISKISWKDFDNLTNKIIYKPGQHFVLDQSASKIILNKKIPTYIMGKDMKELKNFLNKKSFKGTEING